MTSPSDSKAGALTPDERSFIIRSAAAPDRMQYYCGKDVWAHLWRSALRFPTRKAAELRSFGMADRHGVEVVELRNGEVLEND